MQTARDVQKSLSEGRLALSSQGAEMRFTRITLGTEVRGRVAGATFDEGRDEAFLVVEAPDGAVHLVGQTDEIQQARGRGGLRQGAIVTLRGRVAEGRSGERLVTDVVDHGRLPELDAVAEPATPLDLDALRAVRRGAVGGGEPSHPRGFATQWQRSVVRRLSILERTGLIRVAHDEGHPAGHRTLTVTPGAEQIVEARMKQRERVPMSFEEVHQLNSKPVRMAPDQPNRVFEGTLVAYAVDPDDDHRYAVLDTGSQLVAIPSAEAQFEAGRVVRARSQVAEATERSSERRRALAWQLDDLEQLRQRERER